MATAMSTRVPRSTTPAPARTSGRRRLIMALVRVAVTVVLLAVLVQRFGAAAFRPALDVLAPVPIVAGLVLGGIAVVAQSVRWRVVVLGAGHSLARRQALVECYRSSAINSVLPGGVAGDALRAWRQRVDEPRGWMPSAVSVATERIAGLCVLLTAAAVVLAVGDHPAYTAGAAVAAGIAWLLIRRPLGRLHARDQALVWAWSALALAALLALSVVVGLTLDVSSSPRVLLTLGVVLLAGMSVPLSIGGWGPREAAGAIAASLVGVDPALGLAMAAGYGLLSTVSVLPGFVALVIPTAVADRMR